MHQFDSHPTTQQIDVQLKDIMKRLPLARALPGRLDALDDVRLRRRAGRGAGAQHSAIGGSAVGILRDEPDRTSTWSRKQLRDHQMLELNNSGMVEIYNHQYLWDNRQEPRVYDAFVDIWDREDLWVAIDRANLNTPNRDGRSFTGFIHWDANTSLTPAADWRAGRVVAGGYRRRDRRVSVRPGAIPHVGAVDFPAASGSPSVSPGPERVRDCAGADEGRRLVDLQ